MSRLTAIFLVVIGFGFAAIGVWMALDDPTEQMMGAVIALFFGACGLVGLMELAPSPHVEPDRNGRVEIRAQRWRAAVFAIGGLAFAVAGAVFSLQAWHDGADVSIRLVAMALGLPFGLVVLFIAGRQALSPGVLYVIDRKGVECRNGMQWRLAWTDIADIGVMQVASNRSLVLEAHPHVPDPPGMAARLNRGTGFSPYAIATAASGVNVDELARLVVDYWQAATGHHGPHDDGPQDAGDLPQ